MLSLIPPTARLHASWLEAFAEFDGAHQAGSGLDAMNLDAANLSVAGADGANRRETGLGVTIAGASIPETSIPETSNVSAMPAGGGAHGSTLRDPELFSAWVEYLRRASDPEIEPPPRLVRCSYFWMVDDGELVDDGPLVDDGLMVNDGEADTEAGGRTTPGQPTRYVGAIAIRHTLTPFLLEQGGHIGYSVRPSMRRRGIARWALGQAVGLAAGLGIDRLLLTCDEDNIASRRTIESNAADYEDTRGDKRRYWIPVPTA